MFSGIIEEVGRVKRRVSKSGGAVMEIEGPLVCSDAKPGDSIAVNGVCLTVEKNHGTSFTASLSRQTIRTTNLGYAQPATKVNLERALKMGDRIGGHLLTGHIDCTTRLTSVYRQGKSAMITFNLPHAFSMYAVSRGAIGVDGLSLTIAEIAGSKITIYVVPYTLEKTTLADKKGGDIVNIEADITAKYAEKTREASSHSR